MQGQSKGLGARDIVSEIQLIKQGLPVSSLTMLSKNFGVPENQMAGSLNISPQALILRKKEGKLKPDESERVWRFSTLYGRAETILGSHDAVMRWFHSPLKSLGHVTPFEFAQTEPGAQHVQNLLSLTKDVNFCG